jgi:predicted AAA+ superfamily ATPase
MTARILAERLKAAALQMPAVAVTGPRQSGKTTLCRALFPDHAYVSLEAYDTREYAIRDPRGFLSAHHGGVILEEVQRTPELFSYLQGEIDEDPTPGRFILTGSQHFGLTEAITQSLAGRIALLRLLPLSLDELRGFPSPPQDLWTTMWTGGYPRIPDRRLDPATWLADYLETYLQRDVRQVLNVTDLLSFTTFMKLAAGRTAQEQNLSTLGGDVGVSYNTVRAWLSVLEASFILFRVPPWLRNLRKRSVKAPKLHFVDSGLACHLLGIREPEQLRLHPLRGAVFESWVASEILKARVHRGRPADLYHLREARGVEVDLIIEDGTRARSVEAKSGATIAGDFFSHLEALRERVRKQLPHLQMEPRVVHGGDRSETRHGIEAVPWGRIQELDW